MPTLIRVIEIEKPSLVHVKCHTFPLPEYHEKGFYRAVLSFSAFFHGMGKGRKNNTDRGLFMAYHPVDWDINVKGMEYLKKEFEAYKQGKWIPDHELPVTEHESIWEFYKAIGYDYKKKRFAQPVEN